MPVDGILPKAKRPLTQAHVELLKLIVEYMVDQYKKELEDANEEGYAG